MRQLCMTRNCVTLLPAGEIVVAQDEASQAWRLACDLQERWEAVGATQLAADDPRLQGVTFVQLQGVLHGLLWPQVVCADRNLYAMCFTFVSPC